MLSDLSQHLLLITAKLFCFYWNGCSWTVGQCCCSFVFFEGRFIVPLGNLDLSTCTETVENISISSSRQLRKAESTSASKSFMDKYEQRVASLEHISLYDFFHHLKKSNRETPPRCSYSSFCWCLWNPKIPCYS
jgi:hypothetical protein